MLKYGVCIADILSKVAGARVETLECLLDTYVEIGELIPSLQGYEQLFKAAPAVLDILERYFCDILEFHRSAMDVFARPGESYSYCLKTLILLTETL